MDTRELRAFPALVATLLLSILSAGSLVAQERQIPRGGEGWGSILNKPKRDVFAWAGETAEQRMARLGTQEDPGADPDNKTIWIRAGKGEYRIEKVEKKWSAFDVKEGWVRPYANVNFSYEIYQETEDTVWVWVPVRKPGEDRRKESTQAPEARHRFASDKEAEEYQKWVSHARPEFTELAVPVVDVTLGFEESSAGLPTRGSWRNALDVADFNKDGHLDIVAPPERGGPVSVATIFLGDGKGGWTHWKEADIPAVAAYGSVAAADLNGDGHLDLVYGMHFRGVAVHLGDGKGRFDESSEGLAQDFPTRRAIIVDVDRDGDLDIVALNEGPMPGGGATATRLRAWLNDGKAKRWTEILIAEPERELGGDFLAAANLNGDKYPDFISSSIFLGGTDTIHLSKGPKKWAAYGRGFLPFFSLYSALTTGRFSGRKTDDAIITFARHWPTNLVDTGINPHPEIRAIAGIERVWWDGKQMQRASIARWPGSKTPWGLASGDFNGDGKLDLVYTLHEPREFVILLGDGKGGFSRAKVAGMTPRALVNYELKVADVNGDKKDDVLVMYETAEGRNDGSIQVFLGRGVVSEAQGK